MAVAFTLCEVYFLWDSHMKIGVSAVEADETSCFIAAEIGIASFIASGEGRHLVQNGSLFPFSLCYEKVTPS